MISLSSWTLVAADELPLDGLQQLGAVGAVLTILILFFWIVYKRERDRADAAEAEVRRLNGVILDTYKTTIPVLEKTATALNESSRALTINDVRRGP